MDNDRFEQYDMITYRKKDGKGSQIMTTAKCNYFLLALLCVCWGSFCEPADSSENRKEHWGDIPGFLDQQHQHSLEAVEALLKKYPPQIEESLERRAALLLLDTVLHDPEAPGYASVQAFFIRRTQAVIAALQEERVTRGARLWKLYDHGFIVRTASTTIAFDIVTGKHVNKDGFLLPEDVVEEIARQCDILFISHVHADHADQHVAEAFIRNGKPVLVPEGLWENRPFNDHLVRLKREAGTVQTVPIHENADRLSVINYPGHQGERTLNNVVVVTTPEGLTFAHTGDQAYDKDFQWIDTVAETQRIDILLPNCWTPDMPRVIAGFRPALVVPGHENELSHTIDHREPHWLNRVRLGNEAARAVCMTWGESYEYVPAPK